MPDTAERCVATLLSHDGVTQDYLGGLAFRAKSANEGQGESTYDAGASKSTKARNRASISVAEVVG